MGFLQNRLDAVKAYFKPTENVRARDIVREIPNGAVQTGKKLLQDTARFGISAAEIPYNFATKGKTTGYYNTPLGRINSFQDESKNRINRGDSLAKSIAMPALKTVLAGSDFSPAMRAIEAPLESAYTAMKYKNMLRGNLAKGEPMIINPDIYKEASSWRGMANPKYHEIFSNATNDAYGWALKNNPNPQIRRIGGGAASGKSEQLLSPLSKNFNGIIIDKTTQNMPGFARDYEMAKNAGKETDLYGILANLMEARKFSLKRELKNGRKIPLDQFAQGHTGAANTMLDIAKKYPDVKVRLKDNRNVVNKEQSLANPVMIDRQQIIKTLESLGYNQTDIENLVRNVSL